MAWLKARARQGVFGQDRRTAVLTGALVVVGLIVSAGYALLNHGPSVWTLETPLDDLIPVVPPFIIPYLTLPPLVAGSVLLFLLFRNPMFQSMALSLITTWLISYFFFHFLQTFVARPPLAGTDVFTQLIAQTYAIDQPYNDFPSIHVSFSTILAMHWWRVDRRIGLPVAIWAVLIIMSTLFVKQHYIADVIGGLILGGGASFFFLRRVADRAPPAAAGAVPAR